MGQTNRFAGKSAFVTGAGRGQGRAHAIAFAREGADVAISDICADIDTVPYEMSIDADLAETQAQCESHGAKVVAERVDVRDYPQVKAFADRAVDAFGKLDVAVPNAGVFSFGRSDELSEDQFRDMIDINLIGVWHTMKAVVPHMERRKFGRIVATGSTASFIGHPNVAHYCAAKHGVIGLAKSVALEQAANGITVNVVCPSSVGTKMILNEAVIELMSPDDPTEEAAGAVHQSMNAIPVPWVEPGDVSEVVLFLASEEARYMTGTEVKIDLGYTAN
jgi:(+)-trans-carveol dehydrogenase